ncbi:unnamed protein product, partial [Amoebophrya sp. A120]|eukprot:GSA120T00021030001.1
MITNMHMQHEPARTVLAQVEDQQSCTRVGQFRNKNSRSPSEVRRKLSHASGGAQLLFLLDLLDVIVRCECAPVAVEEEHLMLASRVVSRPPIRRSGPGPQQVLDEDHARRHEVVEPTHQFLLQAPVFDLRFVPTDQEVETASGGGIVHQPASTRTSE